MELADRLRGAHPNGICDTDEAGRLSIDNDEHHGLAIAAKCFGPRGKVSRVDPEIAEERAIPEGGLPAVHFAAHALSGERLETRRLAQRDPPLLAAADDRGGERMLASALEGRGEPQQRRLVHTLERDHSHELRLALGERARLVDDEGVDFAHDFDRLGVPEEHAEGCRLAGGDHDRHGGGEAKGAGAGDDQHRDRIDEGVGHARLWADEGPSGERQDRDADNERHEVARDHIGELLDRGTAALGLGDHRDDPREERFGANLLRTHDQGPGAVDRRADDLVASALLDRNRLATDHRLVDGARSLKDHAVDRDALAGSHP